MGSRFQSWQAIGAGIESQGVRAELHTRDAPGAAGEGALRVPRQGARRRGCALEGPKERVVRGGFVRQQGGEELRRNAWLVFPFYHYCLSTIFGTFTESLHFKPCFCE